MDSLLNAGQGKRFFFSPQHPYWLLASPSLLFNSHCHLSVEKKHSEHEADVSPLFGAKCLWLGVQLST